MRFRVVLLTLLLSMAGCFGAPGDYRRFDGKPRVETQFGEAGSWTRPLQRGRSTRDDVRSELGEPHFTSDDDSVWRYSYAIETRRVIMPLGLFASMSMEGEWRNVDVTFDAAGRVASWTGPMTDAEAALTGHRVVKRRPRGTIGKSTDVAYFDPNEPYWPSPTTKP
jgi:outer membrane protein assembly factor BamE (lipoprotein component of BamABCDE complex)